MDQPLPDISNKQFIDKLNIRTARLGVPDPRPLIPAYREECLNKMLAMTGGTTTEEKEAIRNSSCVMETRLFKKSEGNPQTYELMIRTWIIATIKSNMVSQESTIIMFSVGELITEKQNKPDVDQVALSKLLKRKNMISAQFLDMPTSQFESEIREMYEDVKKL